MKFIIKDTDTGVTLVESMDSRVVEEWAEAHTERGEDGKMIWPDNWYYDEIRSDALDLAKFIRAMPDLSSVSLYRSRNPRPAVIIETGITKRTFTGDVRSNKVVMPEVKAVVPFSDVMASGMDLDELVFAYGDVKVMELCDCDDLATERW